MQVNLNADENYWQTSNYPIINTKAAVGGMGSILNHVKTSDYRMRNPRGSEPNR